MTKTWLGVSDPYARRDRILSLDPDADAREIIGLFYADFRSVMLPQGFNGFMMTFASPRISRVLAQTGEIENRIAKRIIDTILLSREVMEHGFTPGPGRDAAKRVNAMHRRYDIHEDDFVAVGCDEALCGLELSERFGWRDVTDHERRALRNYYDLQSRAYGSRRGLPETTAQMQAFWAGYLDDQARFEPQNRRLADATLGFFLGLFPRWMRPGARVLLLGQLEPRVLVACGYRARTAPERWAAHAMLRAMGRRDPVPDGAPDDMQRLVAIAYPDGWTVGELGTHQGDSGSEAKPAA
ncbi:oxygenase MpaB family protein [Novosphingobium sp. PC22D]|uniref:oxygenase MpaB family protein n=1 Tax=Novosphingobium sp. PC22D TaxID=1962403 RepID=UPI0011453330|nr:oxygenase MpaB family protein [Novosphingobium sp. PC22D]